MRESDTEKNRNRACRGGFFLGQLTTAGPRWRLCRQRGLIYRVLPRHRELPAVTTVEKSARRQHRYRMHTFYYYARLAQIAETLRLLETFYPLDKAAYDSLFSTELKRLAMQTTDPRVRRELEDLEGFSFSAYITAAVRNSGVSDPRELDERVHDVVSKLLLGKLFAFDPVNQPFAPRFKRSVANAVRNQVAKDRSRRRHIPSVPITSEPGVGVSPGEIVGRSSADGDERVVDQFADLVHERLGPLGSAVLRAKLEGDEVKGLIGSSSVGLGDLTSYKIKQTVIGIKRLAKEFARQRGDEDFLNQVERAMDAERRTLERRFGKTRAVAETNLSWLQ